VAIKSLHDRWVADASKRTRFFRGARVMFRLSHPHIVKVLQPKGSDPPYLYFVMEYVRFGTLEAGLRRRTVDIETGLKMLVHIGQALDYAHSQGYVHRDVKPSNVLIAENCVLCTRDDNETV
jgi:serine/threonine protein kinase